MATCADCGAPINFVSTPEGRLALDQRMDSDGEDRWVITEWEAQPIPRAMSVAPGHPQDCYVAHRKVCPFTS
jgi:hypothetical protein